MRSRKFKAGSIDVGYNGASGEPEAVGIGYWIGEKRLDGDSYVDLGHGIEGDGATLKVVPEKNENTSETIVNALDGGRDTFLIYIDKMYEETCIDFETEQKLC
jgi:hypothetical protein